MNLLGERWILMIIIVLHLLPSELSKTILKILRQVFKIHQLGTSLNKINRTQNPFMENMKKMFCLGIEDQNQLQNVEKQLTLDSFLK